MRGKRTPRLPRMEISASSFCDTQTFVFFRSDFVYDLVEHMKPTPGANSKSAKKRPTVSSQFRVGFLCDWHHVYYIIIFYEGYVIFTVFLYSMFCFVSLIQTSLTSLMTTLSQAHPYFVRCIKPNGSKVY